METAELIQDHRKIPVVFLTSCTDEHYLERAEYIFPNCFPVKPCVSIPLLTTLTPALNVAGIERERSRVNWGTDQKEPAMRAGL